MWPFESKETKRIKKIIYFLKEYIVKEYENKGLITLYLGGTILTKDRTSDSDIDLFGIVGERFKPSYESALNKYLDDNKDTICKGFEVTFKAIGISELEGKEHKFLAAVKSKGALLPIYVRAFAFYKRLWGQKINFSRFKIKPPTYDQEAKNCIFVLENIIIPQIRSRKPLDISQFPKQVINLIKVEMMIQRGYIYDPSYKNIVKFLRKEQDHLIHKCYNLRQKGNITYQDCERLIPEVTKYIKTIKNKIDK